MRVCLVPLDDRPATWGDWVRLAELAGLEVTSPPAELLGRRRRPADVEALWEWLEEARALDAAFCAAEMLLYGGLVASRVGFEPQRVVIERTRRLVQLARKLAAPVYVSTAVLRAPAHPGGEEPDYWAHYGPTLAAYSELRGREELGSRTEPTLVQDLLEDVPARVVEDFLWRRRRNLLAQLLLVASAARGAFRYLLVGQDDTAPWGWPRADLGALQAVWEALGRPQSVGFGHGADELGQRLLARWLNGRLGNAPRVAVRYTWPEARRAVPLYEGDPLEDTVASHLASCGVQMAEDAADVVLWVHNFPDRQEEAEAQRHEPDGAVQAVVEAVEAEGRLLAVADVRYANGADGALVRALLDRPELVRRLAGYAGWNTASNTLGSALAQPVVVHHLRAGRLSSDGADARRRALLLHRLVHDWGYAAVVRPKLRAWHRGPAEPGPREDALAAEAQGLVEREVLPVLEPAFPGVRCAGVRFPWGRLFEAEVDVR
ncbi:hypothetical protein HRbin32_01069 [bacterium HR32]|nr:hypothetical protein HRbin32_01069 [bacterium HR32]